MRALLKKWASIKADDQFTGAFPRYSGAISAVIDGPPEDINQMPACLKLNVEILIYDGSDLPEPRNEPLLFTVGHSTLPVEEFIERMQALTIGSVIDIRTIPASRHNPQFGKEALESSLKIAGISYVHLKELGGLRKPAPNSMNDGWRNASFRGYADYMQSLEFKRGLEKLIGLARKNRVVILCAEAVPWRCHRSLVADALVARGFVVKNIFPGTQVTTHVLNPMAKVSGEKITYPRIELKDLKEAS